MRVVLEVAIFAGVVAAWALFMRLLRKPDARVVIRPPIFVLSAARIRALEEQARRFARSVAAFGVSMREANAAMAKFAAAWQSMSRNQGR